jgi:hypothetical protein
MLVGMVRRRRWRWRRVVVTIVAAGGGVDDGGSIVSYDKFSNEVTEIALVSSGLAAVLANGSCANSWNILAIVWNEIRYEQEHQQ